MGHINSNSRGNRKAPVTMELRNTPDREKPQTNQRWYTHMYTHVTADAIHASARNIYFVINSGQKIGPRLIKTRPFSLLQVRTTQLAKMSIDPKFVELMADVLETFLIKC